MRTSLVNLLKESAELGELNEMEKHPDLVDEVGKFFVVEKPSKDSTKDDILFQSDIFYFANQIKGGLKSENVVGLYKNKSDANRIATELLKARDTQLDELKASMKEYRTTKKDIEDKKSKAKELIQKLK
jgi:Arc/MetJ-type ribon-helix-helix transcriptional regulator